MDTHEKLLIGGGILGVVVIGYMLMSSGSGASSSVSSGGSTGGGLYPTPSQASAIATLTGAESGLVSAQGQAAALNTAAQGQAFAAEVAPQLIAMQSIVGMTNGAVAGLTAMQQSAYNSNAAEVASLANVASKSASAGVGAVQSQASTFNMMSNNISQSLQAYFNNGGKF